MKIRVEKQEKKSSIFFHIVFGLIIPETVKSFLSPFDK